MEKINYEIDFLPVGNGDKSGDAIAIRYGTSDNYKIMVVDGGTKESGQQLVKHIRKYYETEFVDYVVNTHPDQDHASGLTEVLQNLKIGELWLHRPWLYVEQIIRYVENPNTEFRLDKRTTINSIQNRFSNEYYKYAKELENIAKQKNIIIKEPYQGEMIGAFCVLSPNKNWYLYDLIPNSDKTSEISVEDSMIKENSFVSISKKILFNIFEAFNKETLKEGGVTSRENESSVILYTQFNGDGILLTGDAGREALSQAYNFAKSYNVNIADNLRFIQIPHHGSRRNVSPETLNKIIGNIGKKKTNSITAFVSAGENDTKHPRRVVTNAFIRRGCKVIATQGSTKHHHSGMPSRESWTTAEPLPFFDKVESYE